MAKVKTEFICSACGYVSPRWLGNCPQCKEWNTFSESLKENHKPVASEHRAKLQSWNEKDAAPQKLDEIKQDTDVRILSGMPEFDRVLGGGFVGGSLILLGGEPGVGKSTIALQLAGKRTDLDILYCAGEESPGQIKQRSARMGVRSDKLKVYAETDISRIQSEVEKNKPDILIIDSIQTLFRPELQSMPGTVAQIRECAGLLMRLAKKLNVITVVIGHVTKEGDLAGPRILEHMVDVVLQFEGDKKLNYRLLRSLKNRFGRTYEIGVFEMSESGLRDVMNPSELFLSEFSDGVSGNAAACIMEGNRPIILEIQALVTPASYGTPQRTSSGFDNRRLSLLLAVLEKRSGFKFGNQDVFINVAGGMKLQDTASDLAVVAALVSSLTDRPIPAKTLLIGEVGLGAEIRTVNGLEQRIREAEKVGFQKIVIPSKSTKNKGKHIEARYLSDAFRMLFGKR